MLSLYITNILNRNIINESSVISNHYITSYLHLWSNYFTLIELILWTSSNKLKRLQILYWYLSKNVVVLTRSMSLVSFYPLWKHQKNAVTRRCSLKISSEKLRKTRGKTHAMAPWFQKVASKLRLKNTMCFSMNFLIFFWKAILQNTCTVVTSDMTKVSFKVLCNIFWGFVKWLKEILDLILAPPHLKKFIRSEEIISGFYWY